MPEYNALQDSTANFSAHSTIAPSLPQFSEDDPQRALRCAREVFRLLGLFTPWHLGKVWVGWPRRSRSTSGAGLLTLKA